MPAFVEHLAETLARAEQQHANALRLHAERLADLPVIRPFDVREPEQRALPRLELPEEARHVVPQLAAIDDRRRPRTSDVEAHAIALRLAEVIEREIRRRAKDVATHVIVALEARIRAQKTEERLLQQIVRGRGVAGHPEDVRPETTGRLPVERFELRFVHRPLRCAPAAAAWSPWSGAGNAIASANMTIRARRYDTVSGWTSEVRDVMVLEQSPLAREPHRQDDAHEIAEPEREKDAAPGKMIPRSPYLANERMMNARPRKVSTVALRMPLSILSCVISLGADSISPMNCRPPATSGR